MKNNKKILLILFGLLLFGIATAAYPFIKEINFLPDKENVEVEIIDDSGEGTYFLDSIKKEAAEESLEEDAGQLIIGEDNEATAEELSGEGVKKEDLNLPALTLPTSEEKDANELRIGFVTDLHVRSHSLEDGARTVKQFFIEGINHFIEKMNNDFSPNFIISNGDAIEGTGRSSKIGAEELSMIKKLFDRTSIDKYWVVGNHELRSVNKKKWKKSLGINYLYKSFEAGNYKIIILDSNFSEEDENVDPNTYNTRGRISSEEMNWLQEELESAEKPVIIFMHHPPLWDNAVAPNGRFPGNTLELQKIFSKYHVIAVFAGHLEDLYIDEVGGVKYYILPGFVKNKKYQKTFSEITIKDKEISIDMSYLENEEKYRTIRITK